MFSLSVFWCWTLNAMARSLPLWFGGFCTDCRYWLYRLMFRPFFESPSKDFVFVLLLLCGGYASLYPVLDSDFCLALFRLYWVLPIFFCPLALAVGVFFFDISYPNPKSAFILVFYVMPDCNGLGLAPLALGLLYRILGDSILPFLLCALGLS